MAKSPKTLFAGSHLRLVARDGWEYAERTKATSVVALAALTEARELILVEQYRAPVDAKVLDLPAGLVGDDEEHSDPEETARLELEEEAGYSCERVDVLASFPSSPGLSSEIVTMYRAVGVRKKSAGGGVADEKITMHHPSLDGIERWLGAKESEGLLIDPKIWVALYFLLQST